MRLCIVTKLTTSSSRVCHLGLTIQKRIINEFFMTCLIAQNFSGVNKEKTLEYLRLNVSTKYVHICLPFRLFSQFQLENLKMKILYLYDEAPKNLRYKTEVYDT